MDQEFVWGQGQKAPTMTKSKKEESKVQRKGKARTGKPQKSESAASTAFGQIQLAPTAVMKLILLSSGNGPST